MTIASMMTEEQRAEYVAEKYAAAKTCMQQHLPTVALSYLRIATQHSTRLEFETHRELRREVIDAAEAQREKVFQLLTHDPVTPSALGKKAKLPTNVVRDLLTDLERAADTPVAAHGNGSHRRWFRTVKV